MTKARILADYVAGGTTAAEFDYMDGVTSNVQTQLTAKAPKASPAFTGTPTGITAAHITSGVLPVGVTGGSGLTALGTVTAGNLSNTAIVYPVGHIITFTSVDVPASTTYSGTSTYVACTLYTITVNKKLGSTSKIVLMCNFGWNGYYGNASVTTSYTQWLRTAPTSWSSPEFYHYIASENNSTIYENHYIQQSNGFTDSSTATGNHTYTMQIKATHGAGNVTPRPGHVQAMEVKI